LKRNLTSSSRYHMALLRIRLNRRLSGSPRRLSRLLRVDHELPEVAVRIAEVHTRRGAACPGDVARRTDVVDPAVAQVLLGFLYLAAPDQEKIGISRQRNIGEVEFVAGTDVLRLVLRPHDILPVDIDLLVLANLDGHLPLSLAPAIL